MATEYQQFFNKQLKAAGYSSPKDIPKDKKDDFFDNIDRMWKGEKTQDKDEPGNSNEGLTTSRAGVLLRLSQDED